MDEKLFKELDSNLKEAVDLGKHGGLYEALNKLRDKYHNRSVDAGWWAELNEVKTYLPERFTRPSRHGIWL